MNLFRYNDIFDNLILDNWKLLINTLCKLIKILKLYLMVEKDSFILRLILISLFLSAEAAIHLSILIWISLDALDGKREVYLCLIAVFQIIAYNLLFLMANCLISTRI